MFRLIFFTHLFNILMKLLIIMTYIFREIIYVDLTR